MDILNNLVFWHWWVIALILMCIEIFVPLALFLSCGVAAVIVGFILLLIPTMSWQVQLFLFAIICVVSVFAGRAFIRKNKAVMQSDHPNLNRRGEQYVGRVFSLEKAIVNGTGRVRVDDSYWRVEGEDMEAGTRIKVTRVSGTTLWVEMSNE